MIVKCYSCVVITLSQIWQQFPCSFEYNEEFLIMLFKHTYASQFGEFFVFNSCALNLYQLFSIALTMVECQGEQLPVNKKVHGSVFQNWKCLHDAAPRYLADLYVPAHSVRDRQQLRSTASGTLLVPRARTAIGQRSFTVNGSRTWNSLPADLRTPDTTLCSFKRHLKAHLFQQ